MPPVKGKEKLIKQLRESIDKKIRDGDRVRGTVGYTIHYAVPVHENLAIFHPNGQAKFLEQPFRELLNNGTFKVIMREEMKKGRTLAQAIMMACLRLQRESQKLVPVDTGALRNSAVSKVEKF